MSSVSSVVTPADRTCDTTSSSFTSASTNGSVAVTPEPMCIAIPTSASPFVFAARSANGTDSSKGTPNFLPLEPVVV